MTETYTKKAQNAVLRYLKKMQIDTSRKIILKDDDSKRLDEMSIQPDSLIITECGSGAAAKRIVRHCNAHDLKCVLYHVDGCRLTNNKPWTFIAIIEIHYKKRMILFGDCYVCKITDDELHDKPKDWILNVLTYIQTGIIPTA